MATERVVFGHVVEALYQHAAVERRCWAPRCWPCSSSWARGAPWRVAENTFDLWMNEIQPLHSFTQGILEAAMQLAGAESVSVTIHDATEDSCILRTAW
jgi:uncharacterized protein (TIGR02265 family)